MKVAGFTFIKNAVKNDFTIKEAILSILPICDEFIIAHGNSDDETLALLQTIDSPKIKIISTVWDESSRVSGKVLAQETDKAYAAISPDVDWAFYIQGDECVHEKYLDTIRTEMQNCLSDPKIEGLLFKYKHFYGSYDFIAHSRRWYRREIRIVRNLPDVQSYRDAQGFRRNGKKLNVKLIDAFIYHYGWVKSPAGLRTKVKNMGTFFTPDDEWLNQVYHDEFEFDFHNAEKLLHFTDSHPAVFQQKVQQANWKFNFDPTLLKSKISPRRKILNFIEEITGIRLFEYKNYKKIN
ncbi:MAG: glycosyltransferase family 2 protein [Pseudarcicella sp.]|nr:glycosyltransferase family 2 protein [Pseudarcicella sp.]